MDPPEHTTFRSLISKTFTPRRVSALEPRIRELTVEHLDRLVGAGECDAINDFAGLLPMDVISEMFAVPREDRAELRRLADVLVHREQGENDIPPTAGIAFGEIRQYFQDHVKKLRANPGEDLLSSMIAMVPEHDILNEEELLSFCNLMIVAGNETTTKLLGNALYWLSLNPSERKKVLEDEYKQKYEEKAKRAEERLKAQEDEKKAVQEKFEEKIAVAEHLLNASGKPLFRQTAE